MASVNSDLKKMPSWDWAIQTVEELMARHSQKCELHNRSEFNFSYGAPGETFAI